MDHNDPPAEREFISTAHLADHLAHHGFGPARPRPGRSAAAANESPTHRATTGGTGKSGSR